MSENKEAGLIQLLIVVILLIGLGLGAYLVQRQTSLKSHASVGDSENSYSLVAYPKGGSAITEPQDSPSISVKPGDQFTVDILVRTPTDEVNLFSAKLKFDKDMIQVADNGLEVGTADPFVLRQKTEAVFSNDNGTISVVGGVPAPGYKSILKQSGLLARMTFKAIKEGKTKIDFLDGSEMYKNSDGSKLELVIQRGLNVTVSNPVQSGTENQTTEIKYQFGKEKVQDPLPTITDNSFVFPLNISITPEELLQKTDKKCYGIAWSIVSPNTSASGKYIYFASDEKEKNYNKYGAQPGTDNIVGGRVYWLYCRGEGEFVLSGKPLVSMPKVQPGTNQDFPLPYDYSKTAKEFLEQVSTSDLKCNKLTQVIKVIDLDKRVDFDFDNPKASNNDKLDYRYPITFDCTSSSPISGYCGIVIYPKDSYIPVGENPQCKEQAHKSEEQYDSVCIDSCPEGYRWPTLEEINCMSENKAKIGFTQVKNYLTSTRISDGRFLSVNINNKQKWAFNLTQQFDIRCVKSSNQPTQQTTSAAPVPPPVATTNTQTLSPIPLPSPTNKSTDINGDGKTDLSDLSRLLAKFNQKDNGSADLNNDGVVNTFDVLVLRQVLIKQGVISGQ